LCAHCHQCSFIGKFKTTYKQQFCFTRAIDVVLKYLPIALTVLSVVFGLVTVVPVVDVPVGLAVDPVASVGVAPGGAVALVVVPVAAVVVPVVPVRAGDVVVVPVAATVVVAVPVGAEGVVVVVVVVTAGVVKAVVVIASVVVVSSTYGMTSHTVELIS